VDAFRPLNPETQERKFLDGILSVTPDVENETVTVRYDSEKLAIKNVEFIVSGTGFDANELPANPKARARLPKDCQ
jgi:hypothetical protein